MKIFDKIKDLFTEEVEVEAPVKKEVIQVEIPAPETKKEVLVEEDVAPKQVIEEKIVKEEKNNYPVFFDEKDFDDIQRNEVVKKEVYKETRREPEIYKQAYRDPYGVKKEEKKDIKKFSPTPIISPIYGVLNKNYSKEDIVAKPKPSSYKPNPNITIDDVRNKAYGTLEDELENTLFGKTSIMFATKEDEIENYDTIEEDLKETANTLDLLREDIVKANKTEEMVDNNYEDDSLPTRTSMNKDDYDNFDLVDEKEETETGEDIDLDFDLKEDNTNLVEESLSKDFNNETKLSDSDLFNLIDDMYGKGDE